jgi:hypothetical protein
VHAVRRASVSVQPRAALLAAHGRVAVARPVRQATFLGLHRQPTPYASTPGTLVIVERWCPRCEWRGDSQGQACPNCGTRLIEVTRPEPDLEASDPQGDPFLPMKAPAPARPLRNRVTETGSEADQELIPDETPSRRQRSIWRRSLEVAWTILPLAIVGAIVASIVSTNEPTAGTKAPVSPTSSSDGETPLPPILVALRGGQGGRDGGLYASLNGH